MTNRKTWDRVQDHFHEALDRTGAERDAFLAELDADLREEVEALLDAHFRVGPAPAERPSEGPGDLLGRYKLLQEIGEGGFGVVYMAEQMEPVRRKVALKIIKLGMDTRQIVARFEAERQALALMDHPNIAKVLDGGTTETGRPYFVMELVRGVPITEYCDQAALDTRARLKLFRPVCHAVQHAHQKGIIHRDLKPTNVMVTLHDGKPVPKVIDFGIAKATDRHLTEKTLFTEFRQMIGTPDYMAPEQAEMSGLDVDTRADVYSLGVLLYELITGSKPFDLTALLKRGYDEILRTIREVDPPRPSTRLSTMGEELTAVARKRHTPAAVLGRVVRGDLDWIVMKALEKDRSRRYESASALAEDIVRHLEDRPVDAGPPGAAYRLRKYVRRHRVGVAAGTLVVLALVVGLALAALGLRRAIDERNDASRARDAEAAARQDALASAREAVAERDAKESARSDLEKALRRSEGTRLLVQSRDVLREEPSLAMLLAIEGAERAPGRLANEALLAAMARAPRRELILDAKDGYHPVIGPRGEYAATAHRDGSARIWDLGTGKLVRTLDAGKDPLVSFRWIRATDRLVGITITGTVLAWNPRTGEEVRRIGLEKAPPLEEQRWSGWISEDGSRCLMVGVHGRRVLRAIDVEAGRVIREISFPGWRQVPAVASNGRRALLTRRTPSPEGSIWTANLLDLDSGEAVHAWPCRQNPHCDISPDGSRILITAPDGGIEIRDASSGEVVRRLEPDEDGLVSATFGPEGRRVILRRRQKLLLVSVETGTTCWKVDLGQGGSGGVGRSAMPSPDGALLLVQEQGDSNRIQVLCMTTGERLAEIPARPYTWGFSCSAGARRVLISDAGRLRVWEMGEDIAEFRGIGRDAFVRLDPKMRAVVNAPIMGLNPPRVWDVRTRRPLRMLDGHRVTNSGVLKFAAPSVAASPDGRRIVTAGIFGVAILWDATTGRRIREWRAHQGPIWSVEFSPDGTRILTASQDESARVWDVRTGESVLTLGDPRPFGVAGEHRTMEIGGRWARFSPDGARILGRLEDRKTVRVWDATDGRPLSELVHEGMVLSGAFCPDGRRIVTGARTETTACDTRLWDAETGACLRVFEDGYAIPPGSLSPDGSRIALISMPGASVRIHDVESGDLLRTIDTGRPLVGTTFSPDGRLVATVHQDNGVGVWSAETGEAILLVDVPRGWFTPPLFTPDSRYLLVATGSGNRKIPVDVLAEARSRRPRGLTAEERDRFGIPAEADASDPVPVRPGPPPEPGEDPLDRERLVVEDLRRDLHGVLESAEDLDAAEAMLRRRVRMLGMPVEALVLTLESLAEGHASAGHRDTAVAIYRAAHRRARRELGPVETTTVQLTYKLGRVLVRSGAAAEAEPLLREVVDRKRLELGEWGLGAPLRWLGSALLAMDRLEEAEETLRGSVRAREADPGGGGDATAVIREHDALAVLGECLRRRGKREEAESLLRRAVARFRELQAGDHHFRPAYRSLIRLHEDAGEPEKAAAWRERARQAGVSIPETGPSR